MVALILTPALCATLLKPVPPGGPYAASAASSAGSIAPSNAAATATPGASACFWRGTGRSMLVLRRSSASSWSCSSCALPPASCRMKTRACSSPWRRLPPGSTRERTGRCSKRWRSYFFEEEKDVDRGRVRRARLQLQRQRAELRCSCSSSSRTGTSAACRAQKVKAIPGRAMASILADQGGPRLFLRAARRCWSWAPRPASTCGWWISAVSVTTRSSRRATSCSAWP